MGVGNRPATCTSCGKRLSRKQWYYRNGNYFCKRRCWETEQEKATKESASKEAAAAKDAGAAQAKEAPAAS